MKFLKEKKGIIISFIVGVIIASSITVYAYSYYARDISYTKPGTETPISVETALNDLYSKSNKTPQQVATLTTQGASYTFQNDGYITGMVTSEYNSAGAIIYFNEKDNNHAVFIAPSSSNFTYTATSIYVPKGTTVYTRENYGTYNLTCYEFK